MKPLFVTLLACTVSVATLAAAQWAVADRAPEGDRDTDTRAQLSACAGRLDALEERHVEILDELAGLRRELASMPRATTRSEQVDVGAAVAEWMAEHGSPAALPASAAEADAEAGAMTADEAIAKLFDPDFDGLEREEYWQRVRHAGLVDEVIAAYEERAAAYPDDPDTQVDLGRAYIEKIQEVGAGPMAGKWAMKADGQFDRALEIDERHWEARFSKAVALSFWPPVFGKQNEAIQQFEVLVGQQEGSARSAHHAQTHLLLGNMYQQLGKHEEALAAWERGLALFPDDQSLRAQLESVR